MQRRVILTSSTRLVDRTLRLVEDMREEYVAIHVQELDRAFFATSKGMTYASAFEERATGNRHIKPSRAPGSETAS